MPYKPTSERPRSAAVARTGFAKMQMSHRRTQKQIQRINAEAAERRATGKPLHGGPVTRR